MSTIKSRQTPSQTTGNCEKLLSESAVNSSVVKKIPPTFLSDSILYRSAKKGRSAAANRSFWAIGSENVASVPRTSSVVKPVSTRSSACPTFASATSGPLLRIQTGAFGAAFSGVGDSANVGATASATPRSAADRKKRRVVFFCFILPIFAFSAILTVFDRFQRLSAASTAAFVRFRRAFFRVRSFSGDFCGPRCEIAFFLYNERDERVHFTATRPAIQAFFRSRPRNGGKKRRFRNAAFGSRTRIGSRRARPPEPPLAAVEQEATKRSNAFINIYWQKRRKNDATLPSFRPKTVPPTVERRDFRAFPPPVPPVSPVPPSEQNKNQPFFNKGN